MEPKLIHPSAMRDTLSPDVPSDVYCISNTFLNEKVHGRLFMGVCEYESEDGCDGFREGL